MKVLLFSPDTFNYYEKIITEMELKGYSVDWINHIYVKNNFDRIKSRLFPALTSALNERYFMKVIDWEKDYDKVIVIKGEGLSEALINKMKCRFSRAEFIYYTWDSLKNVKGVEGKLKYFDKKKSFDREDCSRVQNLEYLPLFFTSDFNKESPKSTSTTYSASFIGTLHSSRFKDVLGLANKIEQYSKKPAYTFFYYPSKRIFKILKLFKKQFRDVDINQLSFRKLCSDDVATIMEQSDVIIDYGHPEQSGLTMRTIEALGTQKKLITNNNYIINEPFFKSENVYIVGGSNKYNLHEFAAIPYESIDERVRGYYSLSSWVSRLIN